MTRIERIQPSLHKKDRVLVYLTGGDLLRITPEELLRFGLRPGQEQSWPRAGCCPGRSCRTGW